MKEEQLTYSQKRRQETRSSRYIDMSKLEELREENRKPYESEEQERRSKAAFNGKFISEALRHYIAGDMDKFNTYSDRTKELVQSIYKNSLSANNQAQELLNRIEGKVKDEVIIENKIAKHIPNQDKAQSILKQYKEQENEQDTIQ